MAEPRARLWADRTFLREVQYPTDVNLTARQSIYAYQHPPVNLISRTLRVTRPGGRVIVGLNGDDHLQEMRAVVTAALASIGHGPWPRVDELVGLDQGETLLRSVFTSVTRHDFVSKLLLPGPEPVADYVRSMSEATHAAAPELLIPAVTDRLPGRSEGGAFEVTTHSGCLVCA